MEWLQVFSIIASNIVLFLWSRAESRADHRLLEAAVSAQLNGIREEIKDFHGRLCALEERVKGVRK